MPTLHLIQKRGVAVQLDKQISETSVAAVPTGLRYADANFTEGAQFTKLLNEISAQPFADMYRAGLGRAGNQP